MRTRLAALLLLLLAAWPALAQPQPQHGREEGRGSGVLALLPGDSTTQHTVQARDGTLAYTATAGTLPLFGGDGERMAEVFYTAYVLKDADAATRPVLFAFNGGPGAASAYLNLGLVGPRLLDLGPDGRDTGGGLRLRDNPDTWLAFADLVLIDPIGTGWSRTAKPDDAQHFWGTRQDAGALAKVVALWTARAGRGASPKFLLGESYGGLRAAKVARAMLDDQGIAVDGIIMLSPLLDSRLTFAGDGHALGAALRLPSLAAAALERRGTVPTREAIASAERFALGPYLTTLAGPTPEGAAAQDFYAEVAALTGVAPEVVARTRGFVGDEYLKVRTPAGPMVASRYDAALLVPDPHPESARPRGPDPILDGATRAYGGAFVAYARDELGFRTDMTYELLSGQVNGKWDWHSDSGPLAGPDAVDELRELLSLAPRFRLLVAHGMTDMATPWEASRYVLDHLPRIGAPGRVRLVLYPGGHMLYLRPGSRAAFTEDARALIAGR